ncbi:hypothetical protein RV134_390202 [Roseovarius sp. EC-HK134]|nr:hypothetical protein RV420_470021 [Roseovarius sp. EC-SD190]VVT33681.1 hypothetical protein RV134_390202 [Roseovarius sp. EC-HK134]
MIPSSSCILDTLGNCPMATIFYGISTGYCCGRPVKTTFCSKIRKKFTLYCVAFNLDHKIYGNLGQLKYPVISLITPTLWIESIVLSHRNPLFQQ